MNLKLKLYSHTIFLVINRKILSLETFLYLIIIFTKWKVGAHHICPYKEMFTCCFIMFKPTAL